MDLAIPRDREGKFEPVLVPKHQRRLAGLDEKILVLSYQPQRNATALLGRIRFNSSL
jgi:transposase-like protein